MAFMYMPPGKFKLPSKLITQSKLINLMLSLGKKELTKINTYESVRNRTLTRYLMGCFHAIH